MFASTAGHDHQPTNLGRAAIAVPSTVQSRWLDAVIEQDLTPAERRTLLKATDIMERLADY
jgi:hypothetical protein